MILRKRASIVSHSAWVMLVCASYVGVPAAGAADGPAASVSTAARAAIEPAAPIVPGEVIAAIQGGEVRGGPPAHWSHLAAKAKDRDDGAYYAYLQARRGTARGPARRGTRETLRKAIQAGPGRPLGAEDPFRAGGHRAGRRQRGGRRRADSWRGRPLAGGSA